MRQSYWNNSPVLAHALNAPESKTEEASQPMMPLEQSLPTSFAGLAADRSATVREVGRLRFGNDQMTAAEVPIFAGPGVDQRWLLEQPAPVSERDRVIWQRKGFELEQERRLVTITLGDGQRAAVPVDHLRVRYVGQDPL
jgi:hypothetical protein